MNPLCTHQEPQHYLEPSEAHERVKGRVSHPVVMARGEAGRIRKSYNKRWRFRLLPNGQCRPEYNSWASMIGRCRNPKHPIFPDYGGRGIKVCVQWDSFDQFFQDMGPRPKGATLDRKDTNGNYDPQNCRWADQTTQSNNRRGCVYFNIAGRDLTIRQISDMYGIKYKVLHARLQKLKWTLERAISEHVRKQRKF